MCLVRQKIQISLHKNVKFDKLIGKLKIQKI